MQRCCDIKSACTTTQVLPTMDSGLSLFHAAYTLYSEAAKQRFRRLLGYSVLALGYMQAEPRAKHPACRGRRSATQLWRFGSPDSNSTVPRPALKQSSDRGDYVRSGL